MKTIGRDAAWLLVGCFIALGIQDSFSRESDEQKWKRLEQHREALAAFERFDKGE